MMGEDAEEWQRTWCSFHYEPMKGHYSPLVLPPDPWEFELEDGSYFPLDRALKNDYGDVWAFDGEKVNATPLLRIEAGCPYRLQ